MLVGVFGLVDGKAARMLVLRLPWSPCLGGRSGTDRLRPGRGPLSAPLPAHPLQRMQGRKGLGSYRT